MDRAMIHEPPWAPPASVRTTDDELRPIPPDVVTFGSLVLWFSAGGRVVLAHVTWTPGQHPLGSWRAFARAQNDRNRRCYHRRKLRAG